MSDANAFDPSTWGDEDDNAPITEDYGPVSPPESEIDRAALETELADLRELERSTQAQLDKALATATAAKTELSRLRFRISTVEQDIEDLDAETDDEYDKIVYGARNEG